MIIEGITVDAAVGGNINHGNTGQGALVKQLQERRFYRFLHQVRHLIFLTDQKEGSGLIIKADFQPAQVQRSSSIFLGISGSLSDFQASGHERLFSFLRSYFRVGT
jgi:hypothetical protein